MFNKNKSWIILTAISICLIISAYKLFPHTFPIVQLDLKMSKEDALEKSNDISEKFSLGPDEKFQVTAFGLNQMEQNFIELDNGGSSKFIEILNGNYYMPYTWTVRHYMPNIVNEAWFKFTPSGDIYGFHEILSDTTYIENLNINDAKKIAVNESSQNWNVKIDQFSLVEEKQDKKPSGRIDYTFVYKLKDYELGEEGEYRLDLVVSGSKLTKVDRYIQIPENFINKFKEMRSFNNTIAQISTYALILFYVLGGIIVGLFFLNKERWIIWKPAIYWALFVSVITMISGLNFLPLSWLSYDTAISSTTYITQIIIFTLINGFADFIIVLLSFVAAESLTRKAFPNHIQFWNLWSGDNSMSLEVVGRTFGGYLLIALDLFFVLSFYFITANYLGWWVPSGPLIEPNMIATPFPWLSAVGMSLHAGFWEECLFRAIPISCAVLISKKYGNRTFWLIFALILQAVIFAGAHANYPSYPSYSRLIELIIPSLFWGFIYIKYGLLPVIISHFGYDVVWFSLPIFTSNTTDLIFDKVMVIFLTLIPLWVILKARFTNVSLFNISSNFYNSSFVPPEIEVKEKKEVLISDDLEVHKNYRIFMYGLFIISILSLTSYSTDRYSNLKIEKSRSEAIFIADEYLKSNNIQLDEDWTVLSKFENGNIDTDDRFVWRQLGVDVYRKLLGTYIDNGNWNIRYVRFSGDLETKAEEYSVIVRHDGSVYEIRHKIPESRVGENVDEDSARILSRIYINEKFSLIDKDISEVKFSSNKLPNRTDWLFEYSDKKTYSLEGADLRISVKISGNEVVSSNRYFYVPEQWANEDQQKMTTIALISTVCSFLFMLIFVYASAVSIARWSKNKFNFSAFKIIFTILLSLSLLSIFNSYPQVVSVFDPTKPFMNQFLTGFIGSIIYASIGSFIIASIFGNLSNKLPKIKYRFNYLEVVLISIILVGFMIKAFLGSPDSLQLSPYWYENHTSLNTFMPLLGNVMNNIQSYFYQLVFFLFIVIMLNNLTNYGKRLGLLMLIIVLLSFLYSGSVLDAGVGLEVPLDLINSTITMSLIFSAVYMQFLRLDISLIPMYVGISISFTLIMSAFLGMYPFMLYVNILSSIIVLLLSFVFRNYIISNEI